MTLIFDILFKQIILSRHKKKVVYICLHYNWKWAFYLNSVLTVGRRPSSTAAGTPATVTTPVNRSTGPPTCQCVCRPRTMPPTPGARTLAANQMALLSSSHSNATDRPPQSNNMAGGPSPSNLLEIEVSVYCATWGKTEWGSSQFQNYTTLENTSYSSGSRR